jgi:hypothetical protein
MDIMKKIVCNVTWQTISPPVESIITEGLSPEDAHIESWGWVDCGKLGKCVQELFARQFTYWPADRVVRLDSIFEHYGHLDVDQDGKPVYTWANTYGVTIKGSPPSASEWLVPFKIPRKVCKGILSLVHQGITRVSVEKALLSPPNHKYYFCLGHTTDGKVYEILNGGRGDGSYRVVEWRPPLKNEFATP